MPPIAKLNPAQAMYHFLSGYTAKVAGTEKGLVGVEPEFSTCFGAPFLPRPPAEYGRLLREYIAKHQVDCWLVNSGLDRRHLRCRPTHADQSHPRAGHRGARRLAEKRELQDRSLFRLRGADLGARHRADILYPQKKSPWQDKKAFDETARKLVGMFQKNFTKYENTVDAEVRAAAPEVRLAAE